MKKLLAALSLTLAPVAMAESDWPLVMAWCSDQPDAVGAMIPIPDDLGNTINVHCLMEGNKVASVASRSDWRQALGRLLIVSDLLESEDRTFVFNWTNAEADKQGRWRLQNAVSGLGIKIIDIGDVGDVPPKPEID